MMEKGKKYLSDILIAIQEIEDFTSGIHDFNLYDTNKMLQRAIERDFSIIGEALNQFRKLGLGIEIQNDKQIIAFRNRLVHA